MSFFSMRFLRPALCVWLLACAGAAGLRSEALPFGSGEKLTYEITWPSGLSLGETVFEARNTQQGWSFEVAVDANLPTKQIRDRYRSQTDSELCSSRLVKEEKHGDLEATERVTFDQQEHKVTRKTVDGGESEYKVPPCARDALAFFYYLRGQIAQGRIPPPDDVVFGAQYQVSLTYLESLDYEGAQGTERVDRILADVSGPASQHNIEILFARDDARTPLLIKIPLEMGTFSLRLVR